MGVLPLQFPEGVSWETLRLSGDERIDIYPHPELKPQSESRLVITSNDGATQELSVILRIDTPIEVDYYRAGGILPFVLRQLLRQPVAV